MLARGNAEGTMTDVLRGRLTTLYAAMKPENIF